VAKVTRPTIDGQAFEFEVLDMQPGLVSLRVQGKPAAIYWAADEGVKWLSMSGCTYRLEKPKPGCTHAAGETPEAESSSLADASPGAGSAGAESGRWSEKGQTLLLLEAMKMEIRVRAPAAVV
jgi:acetyl/propionyl-CoA carboxylase alpha subunit